MIYETDVLQMYSGNIQFKFSYFSFQPETDVKVQGEKLTIWGNTE